jgi:5-methylcytosine-specific restriction endonuclease McrA
LRHTIPDGDVSAILDRALTLLLADLSRTKFAATDRPRRSATTSSRSRHIPAAVKRDVWTRDGGRCAFQGEQGRCAETGFLEFHHVVPYADGGETSVSNIQLRCRTHNQYEANLWSGATERPVAAREARGLFGA